MRLATIAAPVDAGAVETAHRPTPEAVRAQLERLRALAFIGSDKLYAFLHFVVEEALAGRATTLKELVIGVELYGGVVEYDPRIDSAVRVEARRLRRKLAAYYAGPGREDAVIVSIPTGGYAPRFHLRQDSSPIAAEAAGAEPGMPVLAVLPFTALCVHEKAFAAGVTDEIIYAAERDAHRLRNSAAAAKAQLLATDGSRATVRLAIAAGVVSGYVQLRTFDERRAILRRTLDARADTLKLIRRRAEAGYGSQLDLAQAEAEYQAAAQVLPTVDLAITKIENGLSILLDRAPGPIARGSALTALSVPAIPSQLPARVLRQRPDIAAAEQQIVAADRALDAARAAFLPDIKLAASGGGVASSLLPDDPLSIFSLGGSILAPIFNGGRIRAQADGAAARRDQAAFAYRRAALAAFREVEDGMASVERYGEQEAVLTRQQAALLRVQQLASRRYREGYSPYLEQLDAERSLLSAQLSLVQARSDRLLASAALFQALGGGWRPSEHREQ